MNLLRQFLLKNLGLKVLSLVIAFLLWLQIASRQTIQTTVSVPVEFINMPPQLEIAGDYPQRVDVVIRSERGLSPDERRMAAVIDLRSADAGVEIYPLTQNNIWNAAGVEIISLTPSTIRLQLERTASRIVKVEIDIVGSPARGYKLTDVKMSPGEVMVTGPESRLQKVTTAKTEPISVEGRTSSFTQDVFVYIEDPRVRIENPKPVAVSLVIEEARREVQLRDVLVEVVPAHAKVRLLTRSVNVVGTVPVSFSGQIRPHHFQAVVDVSNLQANPEAYEIIPRIVPAEEYRNLFRTESVSPSRVKVRKLS